MQTALLVAMVAETSDTGVKAVAGAAESRRPLCKAGRAAAANVCDIGVEVETLEGKVRSPDALFEVDGLLVLEDRMAGTSPASSRP